MTEKPKIIRNAAKAPAILKGLRPLDVKEMLAKATPEQVQALTYQNFALYASMIGVKVDNHKLEFDNHRYLLPIYLDMNPEIVWQKAAQLGATVYMLLRLLWFCRTHELKAGLYFPTDDGVKKLSKDRLGPMIKSNPEMYNNINDDSDTLGLKRINNIQGTTSSLYIQHIGGQSSKDSVPLDVVAFDEVRLVAQSDIDQALERISHSSFKHKVFMSTCGLPGQDINRRYENTNQLIWKCRCNCLGGFNPEDTFPNCIAENNKGEVYLRCPRCKYRIIDPQNGNYEEQNPGNPISGYRVSQLISKFISIKEIWDFYKRTTNIQEFYNAKLARPWVDKENMPMTLDVIEQAQRENLRWLIGSADKKKPNTYAMGVDQHSGNNYVCIVKRGPDGTRELVHFELIDSGNPRYWVDGKPVTPFKRLYELMNEWDIGLCIIDAMPNANEAMTFARAFPRRVFISYYKNTPGGADIVQWADRPKFKQAVKKGSQDIKFKHSCQLNRFLSIDYLFKLWTDGVYRMPKMEALEQLVRNKDSGNFETESIINTHFAPQMCSMVRQMKVVGEENEGKYKPQWINIGPDHACHAMNFANIALDRLKQTAIFVV